MIGGHDNHFASLNNVRNAVYLYFCLAFYHLHGGIERGRMFAKTLSFVEREERKAAGIGMYKFLTNNATFGISNRFVGNEYRSFFYFLNQITMSL